MYGDGTVVRSLGGHRGVVLRWPGLVASHENHGKIFFFFQAEDGIRDSSVTGVQTCALPISPQEFASRHLVRQTLEAHHIQTVVDLTWDDPNERNHVAELAAIAELGIERKLCPLQPDGTGEIGRASCRERV